MGKEGWVGLCLGGPVPAVSDRAAAEEIEQVQRVQLQPEDKVGGDVRLQAHANNASAIVLAMRLLGRSAPELLAAGVSRTRRAAGQHRTPERARTLIRFVRSQLTGADNSVHSARTRGCAVQRGCGGFERAAASRLPLAVAARPIVQQGPPRASLRCNSGIRCQGLRLAIPDPYFP